jgi:hypothetical protein
MTRVQDSYLLHQVWTLQIPKENGLKVLFLKQAIGKRLARNKPASLLCPQRKPDDLFQSL